ncbi:DUF3710 domain-containing protein [Corynebacterium pelargi]|uniref:Uncharacterized protein n=1 Tax=Corynebacterium pelargi TaxID=1471400 RepID=A0A410W8G5_9CORY|nr:DUF3710 domain-containing protein [Corynebacterium pelargi]QAU52242.1 hypothetical protein CPELA_04815 [Corynebacterium pelargi]GGG69143.1 hypothetical protein GCM10007338_02260 [Corynebacterium pelargi]
MALWPFGKKDDKDNNEEVVETGYEFNEAEQEAPEEERSSAVDIESVEGVDVNDEPYQGTLGAEGPYDAQEHDYQTFDFSDFSHAALNLGSMIITLPHDSQVQVEMGERGPKMLHILTEHGRFTPVAFAAPVSGGQWRKLAKDTAESMRSDGLRVVTEYGPFGREVVGRLDAEQSNIVRVIGVDGPRWMLRFTIASPEASADQAAELAREVIARSFVNRGDTPILAGESLPVALPAPLAEQVQQEMQRRQQQQQQEQQQ